MNESLGYLCEDEFTYVQCKDARRPLFAFAKYEREKSRRTTQVRGGG